jgi:hypothetical protein
LIFLFSYLSGDQIVPLGFNSERKEAVKLAEGEVWVESDAGLGYKDSNLFGPIRAQTVQVTSDQVKYDWILTVSNFEIPIAGQSVVGHQVGDQHQKN